jgi:hypothetical protein
VPRFQLLAKSERVISRVPIRTGQKPGRGAEENLPRLCRMPCSSRACRLESELFDGSLGTIFVCGACSPLAQTKKDRPQTPMAFATGVLKIQKNRSVGEGIEKITGYFRSLPVTARLRSKFFNGHPLPVTVRKMLVFSRPFSMAPDPKQAFSRKTSLCRHGSWRNCNGRTRSGRVSRPI